MTWRSAYDFSVRHARQLRLSRNHGRPLSAETGVAQTTPARLTVRPREMATGTQNVQAGEQTLDSEAYRAALVSARATAGRGAGRNGRGELGPGENIEFMKAHRRELDALEATGMWSTP